MIIHNYATIKSLPSVIVRIDVGVDIWIGVRKHSLLWRDIVEQALLLDLLREKSHLGLSVLG